MDVHGIIGEPQPQSQPETKSNSKAIIFDYMSCGNEQQHEQEELQNGHHYIWPLIGAIWDNTSDCGEQDQELNLLWNQ